MLFCLQARIIQIASFFEKLISNLFCLLLERRKLCCTQKGLVFISCQFSENTVQAEMLYQILVLLHHITVCTSPLQPPSTTKRIYYLGSLEVVKNFNCSCSASVYFT